MRTGLFVIQHIADELQRVIIWPFSLAKGNNTLLLSLWKRGEVSCHPWLFPYDLHSFRHAKLYWRLYLSDLSWSISSLAFSRSCLISLLAAGKKIELFLAKEYISWTCPLQSKLTLQGPVNLLTSLSGFCVNLATYWLSM
mgnify:CR=1 FL=1